MTSHPTRRSILKSAACAAFGAACTPALRAAQGGTPESEAHDHGAHLAKAEASRVKRSVRHYVPAAVPMLRHDGKRVDFAKALDDGRPVLLNFVFTSCTAICPVMSQVYAEVIDKLGAHREQVNLVSVSIDPEYDTPARLEAYAQRFGGRRGAWSLYTGSARDSVAIQKSFGSYFGDKMNHTPVSLLRQAPGKPWVRLDGFASPGALLAELHAMMGH
jgi:protein SCO1